ncbi:MAG TPA: MBL fold metallo-hydrolase [Rhodanobacteraceae bacterium]
MSVRWTLRFLGTGSAQAVELGNSAGVIECDSRPLLLIDCGQHAIERYFAVYGAPPPALFLTHLHLDHVGGLEWLFQRLWFNAAWRGRTRVYVPAAIVPLLQARVADFPNVLAEGGVNFWDAFQLIPTSRGFWCEGWWFEVFANRHHRPGTSFGLALPGALVWTGDTRPIPEVLAVHAARGERIAHDCGVIGNPSHTGLDDLAREYSPELRARLVLYHYGSAADGKALAQAGYRVAKPGDVIGLTAPQLSADAG